MRRLRLVAGAICLAAALTGCGHPSRTGTADAMTRATQTRLRNDVQAVSTAAARHDLAGVRAALAALDADAAAAAAAGLLSDAKLARIRLMDAKIQTDLTTVPTASTARVAAAATSAHPATSPAVSPRSATSAAPRPSIVATRPAPTPAPTRPVVLGPPKPSKPGKGHKPPKR